jgi:hypothetical protein
MGVMGLVDKGIDTRVEATDGGWNLKRLRDTEWINLGMGYGAVAEGVLNMTDVDMPVVETVGLSGANSSVVVWWTQELVIPVERCEMNKI